MPRLLPKYDIQIIHAIKNANKAWNFAIPEAISEQTGSPVELYNELMLNRYMTNVFCDYVGVCDNPEGAVRHLFQVMRDGSLGISLWYTIAMVLDQVQVKTKNPDGSYRYINGFWDIQEEK